MTLSVFWNSPYRPSLTTTQISLRITTLLLSISCLAITINLSLHFSLTYLIVYIALMFSIFVSQAAIMKLISKPSHHNFCAEHLILVGFEALVLAYWTIVFVLMKTGKGTLDSEDISTLHTLLITVCLISGYRTRRALLQQRVRRKRKPSHINTLPSSRYTSSRPSPNTVFSGPLPTVTVTPKPTLEVTSSNLTHLGTVSRPAPAAATPAMTSLRPTPSSTMNKHTPP